MKAVLRVAASVVAACCLALALTLAQACVAAEAESSDRVIEQHTRQLARPLAVDAQHTLDRIQGTGRQLLALRSYLRASNSLASRWSWSEAEIASYRASQQYQDVRAEIAKITTLFERSNPGFTLYANSEVRSLDDQIGKWNSNAAVGEIADQLLLAARAHLAARLPDQLPPSAKSSAAARRARFREFLLAWQPGAPAPLAAPGLSLHGRGRALDFQVQQGNRIVAATDMNTVASVWVGQGWAQRLAAAIDSASGKLRGPLTMPNEPWHFEYEP